MGASEIFSISPVTDLRCLNDSFTYIAKNYIAPMGFLDVWTKLYIGNSDPGMPLLLPQMVDYTGLPPLHMCVGTNEIHLDDCGSVARKAKEQGVDVTLRKRPRMVHAFATLSPLFPEAENAMLEIWEFAKSHVKL